MADLELDLDDYQENAAPDAVQDDGGEAEQAGAPEDPLEGREDLQKTLYALYLKVCEEDRFARIQEIRKIQQQCLYWRELQYWWWNEADGRMSPPTETHGLTLSPEDPDDLPKYQFTTNIYQGFGLSLIAAMSQAPPRTRFFPDDAENPEDVETAEGYTSLTKIIERWNPIQPQMQDEIFHLWTGGVVGSWVRYVSDESFGLEKVEELEEQNVDEGDQMRCAQCGWTAPADLDNMLALCPECGAEVGEDNIAAGESASVPASRGESQVPKGREIVTIVGGMNLKRPLYVNEQADFHYLGFEEEIHYATLRRAYPDKAEKIKPGAGNGENNWFERNARLSVMSGSPCQVTTGESWTVTSTFARVWFRPSAFWCDGVSKEHREELLELFPSGCRVYFAGAEYCESAAENMDTAWSIAYAMPGNGSSRPSLGQSMVSIQDRYNTWSNIEAETYEYGIPITYEDGEMIDPEAKEFQRSEPGNTVTTKKIPQGDSMAAHFLQLRGDQPSAAMMDSMKNLMGPVAQFLTGAFPALLGAGAAQGAAGDTASGYKMQMDQALGRCGVTYVRLKQFHSDTKTLACKDFCRHVQGKASMSVRGKSGEFEAESVDTAALNGMARAYPESDENFPETWTAQRGAFFEILQLPFGQMLLSEPDNADLANKLSGVSGLVLPGTDGRNYALRVIGQLTETQKLVREDGSEYDDAVLLPPEFLTGIIDELEDHAAVSETGKRWLFTEQGLKTKREHPNAWANVHAWVKAEMGLVPPPKPPEKPVSPTFSVAFKDLPPEAQAQALAQFGINVTPQDFLDGVALAKAKNSKPTLAAPGQPAPAGNPAVAGLGAVHG